ncbi:UNVERIFIED_CONTAM: hypothetical protein HHA_456260, partial [Hammondia hammondi]
MVFWGPPSLLHLLLSLQALTQWLGVLRIKPVSKGGIIIRWFPSSPELQAVTASHTPGDAASTESGESSDSHDGDSAASADPENVSASSRRQWASGMATQASADNEGSRSTLAQRLEKQLEQLRSQRRRIQTRLRNQRCRWSVEDNYVKYRMRKRSAPSPSPENLMRIRATYRSAVDKKRREMSVVEQSIREIELQEATLRARLLECRRGCRQTPAAHITEGAPGPSASPNQFEGKSPYIGPHSAAMAARKDNAPESTKPHRRAAATQMTSCASLADSGGGGSGPPLGVEERLELARAQKRRTQMSLHSLRHHWLTEAAYVKYRTVAAKSRRYRTGRSPVSPLPETLEWYKSRYRSTAHQKRQQMSVLEQSIREMEIEEAKLRALLLGCLTKGGEAPAEPGTERHPRPSTPTAPSEGLGAQGGPGVQGVSAGRESGELPEATSPVPGCSWWSTSPPATSLRPLSESGEPGPSAEERVTRLQNELRLLRARRTNLLEKRRSIRRKWRDVCTFIKVRLQKMNNRRQKMNMAAIGLSPELHQQLSQEYRERYPQRLAHLENLSKEIMMLEETEHRLAVQLLHARQSSDLAAEAQTQAPALSSSTEPAETSAMAGRHAPGDTRHVTSDLAERQSEAASEQPSDEAVVSPFFAQDPTPSSRAVTTTEGAWRESAALSAIGYSMSSGDLTSSDWIRHVESTSRSPSSLISHHQTALSFAAGDPQAAVSAGPWSIGDCGTPPYSLPPPFVQPGAAYATGDPRTESDIPEDVLEFVLSHSAPAVPSPGDRNVLLEESTASFLQPWSSEYSPPPIVSPSEQAATSASWFQPTTSTSDDGATPSA